MSDVGEAFTDSAGRRRRRRVYFRVDDDGPIPYGPKPRSDGYRRAAAALQKHIQAQRFTAASTTGITADQLARAYVAHGKARVEAGELKPASLKQIRDAFAVFMNYPPEEPVRDLLAEQLGPAEVEAFLRGRTGPSGHYPRRIITTILAAWSWAARTGLIAHNRLRDVRRPRGPARTGRRPDRKAWIAWWRRSWAKARQAPRHRTANRLALLLIKAIADTGARPGELCRARWDELELHALVLAPSDHKNVARGKLRLVLFPRHWHRTLRHLRAHGHPTYLFTHGQHRAKRADSVRLGDADGEPWAPHPLATWARRWEMPCTLYDLRRLVASELADAGLDYQRIADLLGNSPAIVQTTYASRAAESLRQELDRVKAAARGIRRNPAE